jgi:protein kinase N
MLFKKYLGDQRQIQKFNELKSLMHFRRQASDDAISSNYPNSSYSTVRDLTSSSLASAVANSPSTGNFEDNNNDWRELDVAIKSGNFITPTGSFQLDKDIEFDKMNEFRRLWKRNDEPGNELLMQSKLMENFLFVNKQRQPQQRAGSNQSGNFSESDHSYQKSNISDSSPSTVISYAHIVDTIPMRITKKKEPFDRKSSEASPLPSSTRPGAYSNDHLQLAQRFGNVMRTMRKPGHHVGPVKNPTCLCETCKRWMLERDQVQGRERAYSFGETPITRSTFWTKNNRYYV